MRSMKSPVVVPSPTVGKQTLIESEEDEMLYLLNNELESNLSRWK